MEANLQLQKWQADQREKDREFQEQQRAKDRDWQDVQQKQDRQWQADQQAKEREWQEQQRRSDRKWRWIEGIAFVLIAGAFTILGAILGAMLSASSTP